MPYGGFKTNKLNPTFGVTQKKRSYLRKILVFRRKTYRVSRLVAEAFLGECPFGLFVCHKDENGLNNKVSNLEHRTPKYNSNMPKLKQYQIDRRRVDGHWTKKEPNVQYQLY